MCYSILTPQLLLDSSSMSSEMQLFRNDGLISSRDTVIQTLIRGTNSRCSWTCGNASYPYQYRGLLEVQWLRLRWASAFFLFRTNSCRRIFTSVLATAPVHQRESNQTADHSFLNISQCDWRHKDQWNSLSWPRSLFLRSWIFCSRCCISSSCSMFLWCSCWCCRDKQAHGLTAGWCGVLVRCQTQTQRARVSPDWTCDLWHD